MTVLDFISGNESYDSDRKNSENDFLLYHVGRKGLRDLRPLNLINTKLKINKHLEERKINYRKYTEYGNEINFFLNRPNYANLNLLKEKGFEQYKEIDKLFVYEVDVLHNIKNINYFSMTSTPEQALYDDMNWTDFFNEATLILDKKYSNAFTNDPESNTINGKLALEEFLNMKKIYKEKRERYLEATFEIKNRLNIHEFLQLLNKYSAVSKVPRTNLEEWGDLDKYFLINSIKGNKRQYATYIPHLHVNVKRPLKISNTWPISEL